MVRRVLALTAIIFILFSGRIYATENADFKSILDHSHELLSDEKYTSLFSEIERFAKNPGDIKEGMDTTNILKGLFNSIIKCFRENTPIIALSIFISIVTLIMKSFSAEEKEINPASLVCYFIIALMLAVGLKSAITLAYNTVNNIYMYGQVTVPLIAGLSIASGKFITGGLQAPSIIVSLFFIVWLCKHVIIPMVSAAGIIGIASNITEKTAVGKICDMFTWASKWVLGICGGAFVLILSLQSAFFKGYESLYADIAKSAIKSVPVVGGYFSDAAGAVFSSVGIIRNTAGIVVILTVLFYSLVPFLNLAATAMLYKIMSGVCEMMEEKRISVCFKKISDAVFVLSAAVFTSQMMFVILTAILCLGGKI